MPVDEKLLLYSLAMTFNSALDISICDDTKQFIKKTSKDFHKLESNDKIYYTKYAIKLTQCLTDYLQGISYFELNTDSDHDINHDFRLTWKKKNIAHISMSHNSINVKDIIPKKLMRICKYKRNTNICKKYSSEYKKINDKAYGKIKTNSKYSELAEKVKTKNILEPICNLVATTLSRKRKCALNLYNHLFDESDRIVFKLYKNKFTMYDFSAKLDSVDSFGMKLAGPNEILITFNNKSKFALYLQTNVSEIKQDLSLKFRTSFKNMNDIFAVFSTII